jgi:hypothetical protein
VREIPTISDGPLMRTAKAAHSFKVINTTMIVECVGLLVSRGEHSTMDIDIYISTSWIPTSNLLDTVNQS